MGIFTMLGLSFFTPNVWVIFPRRRSTVDAEVAYLETLEAGNLDEPLYIRRKELGLSDWQTNTETKEHVFPVRLVAEPDVARFETKSR
ncbi:hypothetical protein LB507_008163 [Fusarium sp. FIESC RH6]|nr:hypothetical protein LB507_008163 [Fusarium sp. FIESC RH6]